MVAADIENPEQYQTYWGAAGSIAVLSSPLTAQLSSIPFHPAAQNISDACLLIAFRGLRFLEPPRRYAV